jgi:nucleotide-binding universal stress UspA family protein
MPVTHNANIMDDRTTTTSQIVVGYDFSPLAELALAEAAAIAARDGDLVIHLVHVIEARVPSPEMTPIEAELLDRVRPHVERALRVAEAETDQRVFTHVRWGQPGNEILALAEEVEADMIVLGTHGRTGLARLVVGSVAEKVVRHAGCPVLVMRPRLYPEPEAVVEPPCAACVEVRRSTEGAQWWCDVHKRPWTPPHRYTYSNGGLKKYHSMMGP